MVTKSQTKHVVTQLARQHKAAVDRHNTDGISEAAQAVHRARINSLAEEASFHPAGSAAGALYIASVLRSEIDALAAGDEPSEERWARMERLAVSFIQHIEQTGGIRREDLALDWFAPASMDGLPFGREAKAA